jgi:hypothetical protein
MGVDELVGVFGPVGGVALFMWLNRDKNPKADPLAELSKAVTDMRERLIKIETIVDRMDGGK